MAAASTKVTNLTNTMAKIGIKRRLTVHDTPEHNDISERLTRTLLENVHAMLHGAGLPSNLWGEALKHAVGLELYLNQGSCGNHPI
jgi:hypothetical protein